MKVRIKYILTLFVLIVNCANITYLYAQEDANPIVKEKTDNQLKQEVPLDTVETNTVSTYEFKVHKEPIYKRIIKEPMIFGKGAKILQTGFALKSNIGPLHDGYNIVVPPVVLMYEKGIRKNIGIGIIIGAKMWRQPLLEYNYRYFTAGIKANYHFNIHPKLDPYIGAGIIYRRVVFKNDDYKEGNSKTGLNWSIGARYYPKDKFGLFAEVGSDAISFYKLGFHFLLSSKKVNNN